MHSPYCQCHLRNIRMLSLALHGIFGPQCQSNPGCEDASTLLTVLESSEKNNKKISFCSDPETSKWLQSFDQKIILFLVNQQKQKFSDFVCIRQALQNFDQSCCFLSAKAEIFRLKNINGVSFSQRTGTKWELTLSWFLF